MVTIETQEGVLHVDGRFSYTRQNADIGDVSTSNANFTNSFSIRKDKNSTRVLKGLGLIGSLSRKPYERVESRLNVNGVTVINNGWLQIQSTDKDKYKVSVLDGNIDFWKAIEGVKLSEIDLSETEHTKTPQAVYDSFTNPYYKYLLGDYGGIVNLDTNEFNSDHLIPSINEFYLFDKIFTHIGINHTLPYEINPFGTWLTYGKKSGEELGFEDPNSLVLDGKFPLEQDGQKFDVTPSPGVINNAIYINGKLKGLEQGYYKITISWTELRAMATVFLIQQQEYVPVKFSFFINDNELGPFQWDINSVSQEIFLNYQIHPTDILRIEFYPLKPHEFAIETGISPPKFLRYYYLEAEDFEFKLEKQINEEINFADSLDKITATEYIRQLMHRYGLTLFYDDHQNSVRFMTIQERLNAGAEDLSEYFIERLDEKYILGNYGQVNRFTHKYINNDEDFNDGVIRINNENLKHEHEVLKTFTHSPTELGVFEMYESEVIEDKDGNISVKYKAIDNRNFIATIKHKPVADGLIYSKLTPLGAVNLSNEILPFVSDIKTTFRYFIPEYWEGYQDILNNAKIHKVRFHMSMYVFLNLDLKKRVYLKQEASYYLINSIQVKNNNTVEAELIKLDKELWQKK